jgi:hypothetical protein
MEVNDAVERSLTTFKRLLLTGVNNTHINNLGKKYALSQGEALSPLSTRAASQPGHARSTPTGEAAGASAAAHASGSAPTLSQDLTPQQLLALAASAATLKPPSCLWKPAEGGEGERIHHPSHMSLQWALWIPKSRTGRAWRTGWPHISPAPACCGFCHEVPRTQPDMGGDELWSWLLRRPCKQKRMWDGGCAAM